mmetsp:Transcript_30422/g.80897  ORF Transcript_30422/g.80897 Transcript_30422/m.80897 type:complete len:333 (-) Transcript_30422:82-1080(-)
MVSVEYKLYETQVRIELPIDSVEADEERREGRSTTLLVLNRGDSFGETSLLGKETPWGGNYGVAVDFVAHTHCAVTFVSLDKIEELLTNFEYFPVKCRIEKARERRSRLRSELDQTKEFWSIRRGVKDPKRSTLKAKSVFFWSLIARRTWDLRIKPRSDFENFLRKHTDESKWTRRVSLNQNHEKQVEEAFKLFDMDGDNKISCKELEAALLALGYHAPGGDTQCAAKFKDLVTRGDDVVDKDEFQDLVTGMVGAVSVTASMKAVYSVLNDQPVSDQVEGITYAKLSAACRSLHVLLNEPEVADMIKEADRDESGSVSEEEFLQILRTFWYF